MPTTRTTGFVSVGSLPPASELRRCVDRAHARAALIDDGEVSTVYPTLARARRDAFAISIAGIDGACHGVGDVDERFSIMSVAKPFVLALVCEHLGVDETRQAVGVNATGRVFNSLEAVDSMRDGRTNPMVNPGAIATTSHVPGATIDDRWDTIRAVLSAFAGRDLDVDEQVLESVLATNHRNRELARQVHAYGGLAIDADQAVELYTMQSALSVTTRDLANMGATLAAGGRNHATGEQVASPRTCRHVLAAMATAGLYERSGDWLWDVGLPGKSGISGCIFTVAPGKAALATYAPPLDPAGNSVRGTWVCEQLAFELGLDVFAVPIP